MNGFSFIVGFLIGVLFIIILSGALNMNGFHFSGSNIDSPIFELKNGTYIHCIECVKAFEGDVMVILK